MLLDEADVRAPLQEEAVELEYHVEGTFALDGRPRDPGYHSKRWLSIEAMAAVGVPLLASALEQYEVDLKRRRVAAMEALAGRAAAGA